MATVRKIFGFRLRAFKQPESTLLMGIARCMQLFTDFDCLDLGTHLSIWVLSRNSGLKQNVPLPSEHSEQSVQVLRGQPMNSADYDNSVACVLQRLRPGNKHNACECRYKSGNFWCQVNTTTTTTTTTTTSNNNNRCVSRYSDWLRGEQQKGRSSSPCRGEIFSSPCLPDPVLGPTQPPIKWVSGALSPGVKRPWCEADRSPATSAKVKKTWICTATPPCCTVQHRSRT
jgi:hypothetical protein